MGKNIFKTCLQFSVKLLSNNMLAALAKRRKGGLAGWHNCHKKCHVKHVSYFVDVVVVLATAGIRGASGCGWRTTMTMKMTMSSFVIYF